MLISIGWEIQTLEKTKSIPDAAKRFCTSINTMVIKDDNSD